MFYSSVAIIGLLILFVINYDVFLDRKFKVEDRRSFVAYRFFIIVLAFFYIVDMLWGIFDTFEDKTLVSVDTAIFFANMAILLFSWTLFVMNFISLGKGFNIFMKIVGFFFLIGGIGIVIANFFTPVLFSYDKSVYAPKVTRAIYLLSQVAVFITISIYAFIAFTKEKDKFNKRRIITLAVLSFELAAAIAIQFFNDDFPIYSMGLAIGSVILYVFIVNAQKDQFREELSESQNREIAQLKEIKSAKKLAYIDPLTGVKNKHAFVELENKVDEMIRLKKINEFSLCVFDLNDLKIINDTQGHEMGDRYIIKSCELIKEHFPDTEVYRYGGDEFVILLEGEAYEKRFERVEAFNQVIDSHNGVDNIVIALGISDYIPGKDNTLRSIFLRADEKMYARKRRLKELSNIKVEDLGNKTTGASLMSLRYELYEMFYYNSNVSMLDMLNGSSCDEIVQFNIPNDSFVQMYHVEGKYFIPNVGPSYKELLQFTYDHIIHPDDRGVYMDLMQIEGFFDRLKNARIPNFDFAHFRYKLQDGTYRWVEQVVIAGEEFGIPEGEFRMFVFDIHNIKSRQLGMVSDEGSLTLGRDLVTGLYSAKEFMIKADEIIANNKDINYCLIAIDIDHFKLFDEWFGREKGDQLLVSIGRTLKDFEKENGGLAGYFGQDDFVVLYKYDLDTIKKLYEKVHATIDSFGISGGFLPAFGVSPIEKDMILVDALDRATIAASRAKNDIRDKIVVYDYEAQFRSEHELRTLTEFMNALQNDEIKFFVQPQVRIPAGQIVCGEALARWIKKDGTLVPPNVFIPILEKYGFVTDLDKHIWEKVCKWIGERLKNKQPVLPISVNVSRVDIFNINLVECFVNLCEQYGVPHHYLKIEITESAYAENMGIVDELVKKLRKENFMVLMDDFGSGYSSLNMLSTLKIDAIKLDAYFLQIGGSDFRKGINILESVINMAKTMALPIIMEGVEKQNQVDFLKDFGVDYVQGYFFYKPLPVEEFEKVISDKKNVDKAGFTVKINEQFRIREFLDKNLYSDSMLNNILGSVAIYAESKDRVDILRYNQQFADAVDVPDFTDRLEHIEQFMPEEDRSKLFEVLKKARENRLTGGEEILRFHNVYGVTTSFRMHFYYLGKKEGLDRYYGSATNITQLVDFMEGKKLVAKYSSDNIILLSNVSKKWRYTVVSHALSNLVGLSPKELEDELNSGAFFQRVLQKKEVLTFIKEVEEYPKNKQRVFEKDIVITTLAKHKINIKMIVEYIGDQTNNFQYILRTKQIV